MKLNSIVVRGIAVASVLVLVVLLISCGGGGENEEKPAAVVDAERQQALGLFDKLPVSWNPGSIAFSANPGSRQSVPVTLTTKIALKNAKIVFVPDLRNAVTVTPDTIPTLAAGQSATVTLTFAPEKADKRRLIAGIALLFDKNATTSQPLFVKVSLVAPEIINGVTVPPEPPKDLNNATLGWLRCKWKWRQRRCGKNHRQGIWCEPEPSRGGNVVFKS